METLKRDDVSLVDKGGAVLGRFVGNIKKVGRLVGKKISQVLDAAERQMMADATEKAATAKTSQPVKWKSTSKRTGKKTEGMVIPGDIYTNADGQQCRDMRQIVTKDGATIEDQVRVCNQDNDWGAAAI